MQSWLGAAISPRQTVARLSPPPSFQPPLTNLLNFRIVLPASTFRTRDKEQFSRCEPLFITPPRRTYDPLSSHKPRYCRPFCCSSRY